MEETFGWARRIVGDTWRLVKSPLYRNAFLIMLSTVIGSGLGFFFWLVVYRSYENPTDIGAAVALFQTLTFLAALAPLGLGIGIIRFLPESEEKPALVNTAATICGSVALVLAVAFLLLVSFVLPELSFALGNPLYPAAILLTTVALALPAIYDQASYAVRRADVLTWRTVILAVAKIPIVAGLALLPTTAGGGRIGVFLALSIATIMSVVVEGFYLLPRVLPGFRPRVLFAFHRVRPMIRFALGNYAANVIGAAGSLLLPALILRVLGGGAGPTAVAYFYIAVVVAGLLNIIPGAVFTSFYAEASQKSANRYVDERRAIALSLALLVPGIVVLWFLSYDMLTWFGDPKLAAGAVSTLRILVWGSVPTFLNSILGTRVRIRKRTAPMIVGTAIATAVTLGLGVYLLPIRGIEGLAIATVVGVSAATPYLYAVARKSFKSEAMPPLGPPTES